ncbi:MAG: helix-turn-helix domain-containing protein [Thermomicrobiales bacterium]|jgi:excisionase family DNA binding protein
MVTDTDYLTIDQLADVLRMDEATARQWIEDRNVPAFQFADLQVRVKRSDLGDAISRYEPRLSDDEIDALDALRKHLSTPRTAEQRHADLMALKSARGYAKELLIRHGGQPFSPSSTELIREMREERSRHVS